LVESTLTELALATDVPEWPARTLRTALKRLAEWAPRYGRQLPWSNERDPYAIWVREIMLQQTTVTAVVPYLQRFLHRFPTVFALAAADEADVLQLWEGLGYYSRARHLHRAARQLVSDATRSSAPKSTGQATRSTVGPSRSRARITTQSAATQATEAEAHSSAATPQDMAAPTPLATSQEKVFPTTVDGWMALPGVGRYTAQAVVSFAYDVPVGIVEANTLRLYCRLLGYADDPRAKAGQQRLWQFANALAAETANVNQTSWTAGCGRLNQALMDLGATVCTVSEPNCPACPLNALCTAFLTQQQDRLPLRRERPAVTETTEVTVAIEHQGKYLLRQRQPGERWAGLWDFPRAPLVEPSSPEDQVLRLASEQCGLAIDDIEPLLSFAHSVTRYRITLLCFRARRHSGRLPPGEPLEWVSPKDFANRAWPISGRRFSQHLVQSLFR
jgi:A/G-specific adenine glycosylase